MRPGMHDGDVGIFFGRPVRSHMLAQELRARHFQVSLYNNRGLPGTYTLVPDRFVPACLRLLATQHQIYLTSFCFTPALCLSLNHLLRGRPYVFNAVGLLSALYRERAQRWLFPRLAEHQVYPTLMDRILRGASRIVCNSRYLQDKLASQFPQYAQKMLTIYNGIEWDRFASGVPIAIEGVPATAPKLLAVMTWDYEGKAMAAKLLIDAMEQITAAAPEARLIIAAKARHQRYPRALEAYLATKPWRRSIRILYNQANIPDLLASSDLFVYATPAESNDSLPRALLEAHAAGRPIVTTATAGCPEVVEHAMTGLVVPYDAQALASGAIELLADPRIRQEFGERGRVRVHQLFSWQQMGEAYAQLFHQILGEQLQSAKANRRGLARRGAYR